MAKQFKPRAKKATSVQWNGNNIDEIKEFLGDKIPVNANGNHLVVATKFNAMALNQSDYLVLEEGELSSLTEKDFKSKYEEDNGN